MQTQEGRKQDWGMHQNFANQLWVLCNRDAKILLLIVLSRTKIKFLNCFFWRVIFWMKDWSCFGKWWNRSLDETVVSNDFCLSFEPAITKRRIYNVNSWIEKSVIKLENLMELQQLLVIGMRNYYFYLCWIVLLGLYCSFLLPNKWFNIPMPRHIRHKKKILYKPMRCPVGIGSKPFIDDTNCCITHIDEPLDSLVFCGLCKININSSRFSKQGTKFGPLSYSFLVWCHVLVVYWFQMCL